MSSATGWRALSRAQKVPVIGLFYLVWKQRNDLRPKDYLVVILHILLLTSFPIYSTYYLLSHYSLYQATIFGELSVALAAIGLVIVIGTTRFESKITNFANLSNQRSQNLIYSILIWVGGWKKLKDNNPNDVVAAFTFINYQEVTSAACGLALGFLIPHVLLVFI